MSTGLTARPAAPLSASISAQRDPRDNATCGVRRGEACRNALYAVLAPRRGLLQRVVCGVPPRQVCCTALYAVLQLGRSVATCCTWHLQRIVRQVLGEFNETRQQPHRPVRQVLDLEARLIVLQRVVGTATLGCRPGVIGVPYWSTRVVWHGVCHPCDSVSHATRHPMRHATSDGTWRACQNSTCFIGSSLLMQNGSPATVCGEERIVASGRARRRRRAGCHAAREYHAVRDTMPQAAGITVPHGITVPDVIPCRRGYRAIRGSVPHGRNVPHGTQDGQVTCGDERSFASSSRWPRTTLSTYT